MRSALRLVWALDVRHLVAHRTRLALSALGIGVGVALAVAVGSLSSSIQASLQAVAEAAASTATIEVRPNGAVGLPPDVLGRVREVDGVEKAGATVESYVQMRARERKVRVLLIGIDRGIVAMSPRAVDADTLRTADPFGLILPPSVAQELGVEPGDEVELTTPRGWQAITVGTVLPRQAAERTRVVVGTVGVLQRLLGRGASYDAVYIEAPDVAATLPRVQRAVGDVGRAGPIAFRGDQLQRLLAGANASLSVGTIVALFVGAFLVYNTMTMAAVERLQEAALLRAVGARRRQVFGLFVAEGALLGIVGSVLGIVGGVALSGRLLAQQGGALEEVFPIQITRLDLEPRVLIGAAVAGVAASLAAAFLPARRIARADPAPALGPAGTLEDPTRGPRRLATAIGIGCLAVGPAVAIPSVQAGVGASSVTLIGFAVTLAGIALLIPTGIPFVARFLLGWLVRFRRTPGLTRLAAGEVLRSPGRTAFTAGAVLLSLALVIGFAITQASFTRAFDASFEDIIAADLYVRSPTWRPFGSDVPLDDRLADELEAIPGVRASWPFRLMPSSLDDRPILVLAYDVHEYAHNSHLTGAAQRERIEQSEALLDPDAVLASPSLYVQMGYELGDTIELPTPTGIHRLRLAGKLNDPSAVNPEIIFHFDTFKRVWGTGGSDNFAVVASDPARVGELKAQIERRFGRRYGLQIDTGEEYRDLLNSVVGSVQQLIGSVQLVAVIVAGLGLANTLLISTLERRRDLGVLRAVGMLRRQLRRMVATEALMIATVGVLLAWGLGTLIGFGMFSFLESQLGMDLGIVFPPSAYGGAAVLGIAAALVAALYPAQRAARVDVVEALQYE